jgi:16S rRNA (guanine527-N7)-methyltransferase
VSRFTWNTAMKPSELLEAQAAAWGVHLDDEQRDRLLRYRWLLASYDRANVIGTKDPGRIMLDHVLDSLSCFLHGNLLEARRVADIGSGGGLPGIPISIVRPDLSTTLIESTGKKARFLRYAVEELALENTTVANARVEDLGRTEGHRGKYDLATTRAVAALSVIAEYSVPLLEVGGWAIAMKGRLESEEFEEGVKAVGELGARIAGVEPVEMMPEVGDKQRNLVVIQKVGKTPERYPRRSGAVAKRPLGAT